MPRIYREAPLNSIWEGSGNVNSLDVLRAMVKSPEAVRGVLREVEPRAGAEPRLDAYVRDLKDELADLEDIEFRARRVVERMAIALQGSLLVRHGDPAVADAFCAIAARGRPRPRARHAAAGRRRQADRRAPPAPGLARGDAHLRGRRARRPDHARPPERGNGITLEMPRELAAASSGPTSTRTCT